MINKDDREIGETVWLRPQTKQAPRECYQRLAAVLRSVDAWPLVEVWITVLNKSLVVHRDNVSLRPPTITGKKEKGGDGSNRAEETRVQPAFRPHPPLNLASDQEEQMLF